jgi:hypothetical protein
MNLNDSYPLHLEAYHHHIEPRPIEPASVGSLPVRPGQHPAPEGLPDRATNDAHAAANRSVLHAAGEGFLKCRLCDRSVYARNPFVNALSPTSTPQPKEDSPSRSLKLLPILGVPSLPDLEAPFPLGPGPFPANSAVRLGDSGAVPP